MNASSLPERLTGVIPPVCTPLTPAQEVDTASLVRLVDHLTGAGVNGLFVLGSTSEAAFLTDTQRRTVVATVTGHVAGRLPVLAGVIDMTTPRVLAHARAALDAGADALVATAPFYARTDAAEIERHYRLLAERTQAPVVAYDLPSSVHTKPPAELLLRLAADGVLAGVKDSSEDQANLRTLIAAARSRPAGRRGFAVLTGSENLVDTALLMGADGAVPGLANIDPHGYVRLVRHCAGGDWQRARAEQERLLALVAMVNAGGLAPIGAFKTALRLRGVIDHATTAEPQIPLTAGESEIVAKHLAAAGLL